MSKKTKNSIEIKKADNAKNIARTERSPIFEAAKEMIKYLNLDSKTQKVQLRKNCYTPHSGDIVHVEFEISLLEKQSLNLNITKSTPEKLVYTNSISLKSNPTYFQAFESTFELDKDGCIVRRDSTVPQYYYKYTLNDDGIQVAAYVSSNDKLDFEETYCLTKISTGSEFINTYNNKLGMRKNACIIYAE